MRMCRISVVLWMTVLCVYTGLSQDILKSLRDTASFYYVDFEHYPVGDAALPIGVFDSGTGGLTVLDAIVRFDRYQNTTMLSPEDEVPDFASEQFIYLADQANMPYGHYAAAGKTELLVEHIFKDVQFLLSDKYYESNSTGFNRNDKPRVKAIIIACNTATAYGQQSIDSFFVSLGFPMKVIGVIDAGSRAALQTFQNDEDGSIAVFATAGTVASGGYEKSLRMWMKELGYTGDIGIFSQGGTGLAEAIDEDINYIDRKADKPRELYKGPNAAGSLLKLENHLLKIYNFDFAGHRMLCDAKEPENCSLLQINDPVNYLRFHLVSLMEKIRDFPDAPPLKTLILGCTHYPFLTADIRKILDELRDYRENETYRYRHLMAEEIHLIDPAYNTADELYRYLYASGMMNKDGNMELNSEFYISQPNLTNPEVVTDAEGRFTYEYKYGRTAGTNQEFVRVVPFARENILDDVKDRLQLQIPDIWKLIEAFESGPRVSTK